MSNKQVKSKQRVADHGEVFTNEREVKAMVDMVMKNIEPDNLIAATFLEPSCGSGNFLVEILERKAAYLEETVQDPTEFEIGIILLATSLYGLELLEDNVRECRERLINHFKAHLRQDFKNYDYLLKSIEKVVKNNVIWANTLEYSTIDGKPLEFIKWELKEGGIFEISKHDFRSMVDGTGEFLAKFGPEPERKHYLKLWELNC